MILSIITVVYQTGTTICPTIESVLRICKQYEGVEYIIIDGNSTDNTLDIINSYQGITVVSENDEGVYDAMNKGIAIASGRWLYFINAGDILFSLPYHYLLSVDTPLIACAVSTEKEIISPSWNWLMCLKNTIPHQGAFYLKEGFTSYDPNYKVFSDYHHNIQLYKSGVEVLLLNDIIAFHSEYGISNDSDNIKELYQLQKSEFGLLFVVLSFLRFKICGIKKIIRKQ